LVKTFGPRGTIHLLATADLPMWAGALSALPSSVPTHPDGVRFTPRQAEEVIAAIGDALADAELTVDELAAAVADRAGGGGGRGATGGGGGGKGAARPPPHRPGRARGGALLRPRRGPQGALHPPPPLAARLPPRGRRRCPARARHAVPVRVRPGHAAALREVARHPAAARRRAVRRHARGAGARRAGRRAGMDPRR